MRLLFCFWACLLTLGCAEMQPAPPTAAASLPSARSAPPKCASCHLAPRAHSLATTRWPEFQKSHRRRIHLTAEETAAIYDFLIGGTLPTDEGAIPSRR